MLGKSQLTGLRIVSPYRVLLRVQIIYNRAYGQFVLLFHADTSSFDYSAVGAAMSASITGPYTYVRAFHPDGLASFDMGVFQVDENGGGLTLIEMAPGISVDDIKSKTEAEFKVAV